MKRAERLITGGLIVTVLVVCGMIATALAADLRENGGGFTLTATQTAQQKSFGENVKFLSVYNAGASTQVLWLLTGMPGAGLTMADFTSRVDLLTNAIPIRGGVAFDVPGQQFSNMIWRARTDDGTFSFDIAVR